MKAIGLMTKDVAGVLNFFKMEINTQAIIKMGRPMEKEFILGIMGKFMMENGKRD